MLNNATSMIDVRRYTSRYLGRRTVNRVLEDTFHDPLLSFGSHCWEGIGIDESFSKFLVQENERSGLVWSCCLYPLRYQHCAGLSREDLLVYVYVEKTFTIVFEQEEARTVTYALTSGHPQLVAMQEIPAKEAETAARAVSSCASFTGLS